MINGKSVLQKLKSKSRKIGLPYQLILRLFCQEEFLRRLVSSQYKEQLILKGGLFLFSYTGFQSRPTMDIDFLAKYLPNNKDEMKQVVERIIAEKSENSYILFEVNSVENIAEMKAYNGVRVKLAAIIENTRTPFDIDIGIGDVVVPEIESIVIPTQLNDFEEPVVNSYSLESTIAEKLETMFARMETSSRMKDYYDIYYLASNYDFDGEIFAKAIRETFKQRGTTCDLESLAKITKMYENADMQRRWRTFTKRSLGVSIEFQTVTEVITAFVKGPIVGIEQDKSFRKRWSKEIKSYDLI